MTKRDFFILILKIFGLYSIVAGLFTILPSSISYLLMEFDLFFTACFIGIIAVVIGLFVLLIFQSGKIVDLLKLEKGFDTDRIELSSLHSKDIIKIGTFIVGGLLLLDSFPSFLSHSLFAFKRSMAGFEFGDEQKFMWAVSGINIVIGYLLMTNFDFVAKMLKVESAE